MLKKRMLEAGQKKNVRLCFLFVKLSEGKAPWQQILSQHLSKKPQMGHISKKGRRTL
jgi:hypothetical protein